MLTEGGHFLVDFWEVADPTLLDNMDYCIEMIRKAVEKFHSLLLL